MVGSAVRAERDYAKWAFFSLMAAFTLLVIYVDERFLVIPSDPEWRHITRFKWWLLPHGLAGATALLTGPMQFSDALRKSRPQLHRLAGRLHVGAICLVAAPLAFYIGVVYEPKVIHLQQAFQAGLWWLTTAVAFISILNRQVERHKAWVARSYCFCLIFILSRVPDAFVHLTNAQLADELWSLTVAALVAPDLALTARDLLRRRKPRPDGRRGAQAFAA
jgi:hypothetical protein